MKLGQLVFEDHLVKLAQHVVTKLVTCSFAHGDVSVTHGPGVSPAGPYVRRSGNQLPKLQSVPLRRADGVWGTKRWG